MAEDWLLLAMVAGMFAFVVYVVTRG